MLGRLRARTPLLSRGAPAIFVAFALGVATFASLSVALAQPADEPAPPPPAAETPLPPPPTPPPGAVDPSRPPPPPEPIVLPPRPPANAITLDVGLHAGVGFRLGDTQLFQVEDRAGFAIGGSVWINPSPRYGFGLEFSHLALGREGAGPGPLGEVEVNRFANAVWAGLRVDLLHLESFEGWVGFGPGLVWDSSSASGISITQPDQPGQSFACSGTNGPHLGLRGIVGGAVPLGGGLHVAPELVVEGDQLSTDAIGKCVAGPGTVAVFTARVGFFFRADVTRRVR